MVKFVRIFIVAISCLGLGTACTKPQASDAPRIETSGLAGKPSLNGVPGDAEGISGEDTGALAFSRKDPGYRCTASDGTIFTGLHETLVETASGYDVLADACAASPQTSAAKSDVSRGIVRIAGYQGRIFDAPHVFAPSLDMPEDGYREAWCRTQPGTSAAPRGDVIVTARRGSADLSANVVLSTDSPNVETYVGPFAIARSAGASSRTYDSAQAFRLVIDLRASARQGYDAPGRAELSINGTSYVLSLLCLVTPLPGN